MADHPGPAGFVRVDHLTKRFPSGRDHVIAVDDVSLSVARGEFVALLGPSGCGKTTLLRILAGQEVPSEGGVWIDGVDLAGVAPERRPVNMVFQSPALFPHMTVAENIAFGPKIARTPAAEVARLTEEMLALVRLEGYGYRLVTQLSGGQAQRVALARALINRPKVLLLDEPLSSLDLKLRQEMQLELRHIHRRLGTTFIYVTHDQDEAVLMADRIVLMNDGVVLQEGSPRDIYLHPRSAFASRFVGHNNVLPGTTEASEGTCVRVCMESVAVCGYADDTIPTGSDVWVVVRPEQIEIGRVGSDRESPDSNRVQGEVIDVAYLGPTIRYEVKTGMGAPILVIIAASAEDAGVAIGSPVTISWRNIETRVLPR